MLGLLGQQELLQKLVVQIWEHRSQYIWEPSLQEYLKKNRPSILLWCLVSWASNHQSSFVYPLIMVDKDKKL